MAAEEGKGAEGHLPPPTPGALPPPYRQPAGWSRASACVVGGGGGGLQGEVKGGETHPRNNFLPGRQLTFEVHTGYAKKLSGLAFLSLIDDKAEEKEEHAESKKTKKQPQPHTSHKSRLLLKVSPHNSNSQIE